MSEIQTPDETLPVEWREREELLPNDWNPNSMSEEKREELVHSIIDNGWTQPIVVNPDTDKIIDGEQRWHASRDARIRTDSDLTPDGVEEGYVPVFYLDVDETQSRVATMQHNVNGETNADRLGEVFADLDEEGMFYDVSDRLQIAETGIDRLIERAEGDDETPEAFIEEPETDDEPETFDESLEFQMTREEAELVREVISEVGLVGLCEWAISDNVHSQTRVDMRELSDRDVVYQYGEDSIEYPSVDIEEHLGSYTRSSDPEEVTADE